MFSPDSLLPGPSPVPWALTDDQRNLYMASLRFARDRLEPLLAGSPNVATWQETVRLAAATLDLGAMILPEELGGLGTERHDLTLVAQALATGPLERALQLTLPLPALMVLRTHHALGPVLARPVQAYFDGTTAIALTVPDIGNATIWQLSPLGGAASLSMRIDDKQRLILAERPRDQQSSQPAGIATLGGLVLEQVHADEAATETPLAVIARTGCDGVLPAQTYMIEIGLYLTALLTGAMQHTVRFAFDYAATRQAFRKPLAAHQLVATRLSDMLIATHSTHLFLQAINVAYPSAPVSLVRQLLRHVATESVNISREFVQLCGGHGYVEGLPPATRFQTTHWLTQLLLRTDTALGWLAQPPTANGRADI
ncbi:acyl-CoA/acyl-ACP dehydrogenase [Burkholderia pseudomultivorans]|uniref:acyl-CoA dehydrogenase family protein n=1 Tax=Burkholderia pseudomultivorans TaxID=1207504 RepID=UPI002874A036|nr:acyl-CoA dehydrogenase family protein [Burkholderia pseudomultivorans]MDS0862935.1 acyl-CoA/acyl-ACP dehydrogenase [Burkholderia pseudomultivorans]